MTKTIKTKLLVLFTLVLFSMVSFLTIGLLPTKTYAQDIIATAGFYMEDGAQVRTVTNSSGIRFETVVESSFMESLEKDYSGYTAEFHTLVNKKVDDIKNLTPDTPLTKNFTLNGQPEFENGTSFTYDASIIYDNLDDSLKAQAYKLELSARSYVRLYKDGEKDVIIYAKSEDTTRSMRSVANHTLKVNTELDEEDIKILQGYLGTVTEKDSAKGYFVTDGESSKLFSADIPDGTYVAHVGTKSVDATVVNSVITINDAVKIGEYNSYVALFDESNNVYNIPFTAITKEEALSIVNNADASIKYTNNDISWNGSEDANIEYTVKVGENAEISMFNNGHTVPLGRGESAIVTVTPKIGSIEGTPSTVKVYGELDITLDGSIATVTEVDGATMYKAYINGENWYDDDVNTRNYSNHLDGTMLHYKVVTDNGSIMSEKIAYNRYNANNFITNVDDGNGVAVSGNVSKYTIEESTTQKHSGEKSLKLTVNESETDATINIVVPEELTFNEDVILSYWVYVDSMSSSDTTANGVVSAWTQVTHNAAPTPLSHKNYKTSAGTLKQMDTAVGYIPKGSWAYVSYRIQLNEDSYIDGTSGKRVILLNTNNLNWYNGQGAKEASVRKSITMYIDDIAIQTGDYNASWTLSASQFTYNLKKYMYVDGSGLSGTYFEDGLDIKSAMAYTSGTTFTTAGNNKTGNTAYDVMQRILFLNHGDHNTVAQGHAQNALIQQTNYVQDGQLAGTTVEMYVYCDTETAFAFVEYTKPSWGWSFDKVQVVPAKTWTKITYTYEFTSEHQVMGAYLAQVGSPTGGASTIKFDGIRIYR